METILVAAWLVAAAVMLGPPLLGVHRSTWPLESYRSPEADREDRVGEARPPTPAGQCRACGEDGQGEYTYCRVCLTPLPRPAAGAGGDHADGHAAD
jgi:hypothetical protein